MRLFRTVFLVGLLPAAGWAEPQPGSIVAWGSNDHGQAKAPKGTGFTQVAAGFWNSMALKSDGSIVSWGSDSAGQVSKTPTGKGFTQVALGAAHSLALRSDGSIVSWGSDNYGQISKTPTGKGFTRVAAGDYHSLALKSDGSIVSWGMDHAGQVSKTPKGTGFTQVAGGGFHSLALKSDGSIVSWGDGAPAVSKTPTGTGFIQVAAGYRHSLALRSDGSIVSWGIYPFFPFAKPPTGRGFIQVSGGFASSFALKSDGSIVSWGARISLWPPTGKGFTQLSAGSLHALALRGSIARLSIKRVIDKNGDSPWTQATVQTWVRNLNAVYQSNANLRFDLVEVVDLLDPGLPDSWFDVDSTKKIAIEAEAEKNPCAYKWRTDAINVYLVNSLGSAGGICSFPACPTNDNDIILVAPSILNGSVGLAHEIGHYLNLRHTHANHEGASCGCAGGSSGDCVADTPDDADPALCKPFNTTCHFKNLQALKYPKAQENLLRFNVMSYHGPITSKDGVFSKGQVLRVLSALNTYRQNVLVGQPVASIVSVSPASAIFPGPTTLTVAGANLPTSGKLSLQAGGQLSSSANGSATSIVAKFNSPVSPGLHCVTALRDGQLVAFLKKGVHVRPSLHKPVDAPGGVLTLEFTSTVPRVTMIAGVGTSLLTPPIRIPGILYTLQISPFAVLPFTTNGNARYLVPVALRPITAKSTFTVQALESTASASRFTNTITIAVH